MLVPKSVLFKVEVEDEAKAIMLPLPVKLNEAVAGLVVVYPFATLPGLTQLDVVPVKAIFVSVPVLAPAASVNIVWVEFAPEGTP